MRRTRTVAVAAAFAIACSTALAGCGGESDGGDAQAAATEDWTSHEALVEAAKKEGSVNILTSFTEPSYTEMQAGFEARYPFLKGKVNITEETGEDESRILLEIQAGQNDADVLHLNFDLYDDFLPLLDGVDLLALIKSGVLDMPEEMINPDQPNTMSAGSGISAITYNKKLMKEEDLPDTWEDLLQPQFKGRKFLIDIEPTNMAALGGLWGEEKLRTFAEDIGKQDPIFVRGDTVSITALAAGEYKLHAFSNYHSAFRAQQESPDTVGIKIIEPVPVRLLQIEAIRKGAEHRAAATLFLEYTASPEAQAILDKDEPKQSSLFAAGSSLHQLTEGKEQAIVGWKEFKKTEGWAEIIGKAWGFPSAELEKE